MKRTIKAYGSYYKDFFDALDRSTQEKKTQKTPDSEIEKGLKLKAEYEQKKQRGDV